MAKTDLTDYERLRAEQHEEDWRATMAHCHVYEACNLRKCRRHRFCIGPMQVSRHQARQVRLQQELGLSGMACASLPLCIAYQDDATYAKVRVELEQLQRRRATLTPGEFAYAMRINAMLNLERLPRDT